MEAKSDLNDTSKQPQTWVDLLPLDVATNPLKLTKHLILKAGGAEGRRTPDLLIANETLYQLSYDPDQFAIKII